MEQGSALQVRVLGLGSAGARALPAVVRAIRESWSPHGTVEVQGVAGVDDARGLGAALRGWCDRERVGAVFTVGRGGHTSEDYAPDVVAALLGRALPGVEELMHLSPPRDAEALLFRGRAGLRGTTLVVNLPERPARARRVVAFLAPVVRHALEKAHGSERECAAAGTPR